MLAYFFIHKKKYGNCCNNLIFVYEILKKKVMCDIVVKKVEENLHWYDCICPKCNNLLAKENERFKCSKCGKYYPWPPKR